MFILFFLLECILGKLYYISPASNTDLRMAKLDDKIRLIEPSNIPNHTSQDKANYDELSSRIRILGAPICKKASDPGVVPCAESTTTYVEWKKHAEAGNYKLITDQNMCLEMAGSAGAGKGYYVQGKPCVANKVSQRFILNEVYSNKKRPIVEDRSSYEGDLTDLEKYIVSENNKEFNNQDVIIKIGDKTGQHDKVFKTNVKSLKHDLLLSPRNHNLNHTLFVPDDLEEFRVGPHHMRENSSSSSSSDNK